MVDLLSKNCMVLVLTVGGNNRIAQTKHPIISGKPNIVAINFVTAKSKTPLLTTLYSLCPVMTSMSQTYLPNGTNCNIYRFDFPKSNLFSNAQPKQIPQNASLDL